MTIRPTPRRPATADPAPGPVAHKPRRPTSRSAEPTAHESRPILRAGRTARAVRRPSSEVGQATVELVALFPVLLIVVLAAAALLAAHGAREQAGHAAQAGAMAMLQGGDPRESARRALPAGVRRRAAIEIRGPRVTVRVRPRLPIVATAMTAEVTADAGPEGSP
jgi:Flp pilus assembly protein TadG